MTQPIKFYLDEHVDHAVARGLRTRGVDVQTVAEAGLLGASDEKQLDHAWNERRVIFTQDTDFLRLHAAGIAHAGIAFAPRRMSIGYIVRGLTLIHQVWDAKEMVGQVERL